MPDLRGVPPLIGLDASRLAVGERTGTEHYTAQLIPALLRQPGAEQYRLYLNGAVRDLPSLEGRAEVRRIPFPRLWTHARLAAEVRRHRPDLLFVPAHVLPCPCPVPAVVTIHDLGYLHVPEAHPPGARVYLDQSTRWSARAARRIIAISAATKQDLIEHYGISANKIDVVHHGIAPRFRPPNDGDEGRSVLDARGIRAPYLLAVGTVQPRKNLERLIEAFARLRGEGFDLRLIIAGKIGWMAEEILSAPTEFGVASHVLFTGYVHNDDVPVMMGHAAAVVLPSLYEGLGMPAAEAMACGATLVCSSTSALVEIAGDAAFQCDPRSVDSILTALRQSLSDNAGRAERRSSGLARAATFTWERCAQGTLRTFRSALEAGHDQ